MLGVLGTDFVRTAESLGLPRARIVVDYAFRNAAIPVITTHYGMVLSFMLGANVLVEKVFAWPGIGSYAIRPGWPRPTMRRFKVLSLLMVVLFILMNTVIDAMYAAVDPRIRLGK